LALGLVYVLGLWIIPSILAAYGIPPIVDPRELARHGNLHGLSLLVPSIPAAVGLLLFLKNATAGPLRSAITCEGRTTILWIFVLGFGGFLLMDHIGLAPFSWRGSDNSSIYYLNILFRSNAVLGIAAAEIHSDIIVPVIEEIVFRFGVLRWAQSRTGSIPAAVLLSALAFGAAHIDPGSVNPFGLAYQTTVTGLVYGILVILRGGSIAGAIALHASRNVAEFVTMLAVILRS
jgi:membrane protease YdiL (CAAX protease family)